MESVAILYPTLALVLLTFLVFTYMYVLRLSFMYKQGIAPAQLQTRSAKGPLLEPVAAPSDNLMNLFEVPTLFYALVAILLAIDRVDHMFVALAWAYVGLRVLHSLVHVTYNHVSHRFTAYVLSCIVLAVAWGRLALEIL